MTNTTKTETVTVASDVHAGGNVLYAGTYRVEMPSDYDPAQVTGEDILCDDSLTVFADGEPTYSDQWNDEPCRGTDVLGANDWEPGNLDELLGALRDGYYDEYGWDDLPTFGGAEPEDTCEVWSWDAGRMIVGTCPDDVRIIPRGGQ